MRILEETHHLRISSSRLRPAAFNNLTFHLGASRQRVFSMPATIYWSMRDLVLSIDSTILRSCMQVYLQRLPGFAGRRYGDLQAYLPYATVYVPVLTAVSHFVE